MPELCRISRERLEGVVPELVAVVEMAICSVDFRVTSGRRTQDEQDALVSSGKSKTRRSRHVIGCAVDCVPWRDGFPVYDDFELLLVQARAFRDASLFLKTQIRWGGGWDVLSSVDPRKQHDDYLVRCKRLRIRPLVDAVHFEIPRQIGTI